MAYVVWRVFMKKYSKVRMGIHRSPTNSNNSKVTPSSSSSTTTSVGKIHQSSTNSHNSLDVTAGTQDAWQQQSVDEELISSSQSQPLQSSSSLSSTSVDVPITDIPIEKNQINQSTNQYQPENNLVGLNQLSILSSNATLITIDEGEKGDCSCNTSGINASVDQFHTVNCTSSSSSRVESHSKSTSATAINTTAASTTTPTTTRISSSSGNMCRSEVRRSKSKVRTYLKKCKDALIGSSGGGSSSEKVTSTSNNTSNKNNHETNDIIQCTTSTSSWYINEKTTDDCHIDEVVIFAANNDDDNYQQNNDDDVVVVVGDDDESITDVYEDANNEKFNDVETDGEDKHICLDNNIDGNDNNNNNNSGDGGGDADDAVIEIFEDTLTILNKDCSDNIIEPTITTTAEEADDIIVATNSAEPDEEYKTFNLLNDHHRPEVEANCGVANLVDLYLGHLYPDYIKFTRSVLVRQARDMLVCTFHGDLLRFEQEFLCPAANIIKRIKYTQKKNHQTTRTILSANNNINATNISTMATTYTTDTTINTNDSILDTLIETTDLEFFPWLQGWPLSLSGAVVLHLGPLDESLLRPQDIYICIKSSNDSTNITKTNETTESIQLSLSSVQLCAVWRSSVNLINNNTVNNSNTITYHLLDPNCASLTPIALEMLAEELPQLLQSLLVGVEHAINRVPLDDLTIFQQQTSSSSSSSLTSSSVTSASSSVSSTASPLKTTLDKNNHEHDRIPPLSHSKYILSPIGSPKCGLKRRELINKNKINNKYALKRMSNKSENDKNNSLVSSSQLSFINTNVTNEQTILTAEIESTITTTTTTTTSAAEAISSNLPLFCLGRSFPHIDSDEESGEDNVRSSAIEARLPHDIVAPRSIQDLPEKLLASGIYLPGTYDVNGSSIITIEAEKLINAGVNCYEIATVLLYYSTIPIKSTFTIHIILTDPTQLSILDLIDNSVKLIQGHIKIDIVLVTVLYCKKNTADKPQQKYNTMPSSKIKIIYVTVSDLTNFIPSTQIPVSCGGTHEHSQSHWHEFFSSLEVIKSQCLAAGRRLISVMADIRASDNHGVPSRRLLYAQHRALSRALMDPDLQNLRRKGQMNMIKLREIARCIGNSNNNNNFNALSTAGPLSTSTPTSSSSSTLSASSTTTTTVSSSSSSSSITTNSPIMGNNNVTLNDVDQQNFNDHVSVRLVEVMNIFDEVDLAARRLEQLTEQRRERLRELTRQQALEDEINEINTWLRDDGETTLCKFTQVPLDCETIIKDHEQDFEKFYFISMKHLAKGQDIQDACVDIEPLRNSCSNLKTNLSAFSDRLEQTREKIEGAVRLHHLLSLQLKEDDVQNEMKKLAEKIGVAGLVERCKQSTNHNNNNNNNNQQSTKLMTTSTPNQNYNHHHHHQQQQHQQQQHHQERSNRGNGTSNNTFGNGNIKDKNISSDSTSTISHCDCWRNVSEHMLDQKQRNARKSMSLPRSLISTITTSTTSNSEDATINKQKNHHNHHHHNNHQHQHHHHNQNHDHHRHHRHQTLLRNASDEDDEEDHSKMADSGLGCCDRCEGNEKLIRTCSCQSFEDPTNASSKSNNSDDLEEDCFEGNLKQMLDYQSPQPNAHLYCYESNLDLPEFENDSGLDPKTQKTLLFIMREMIGTERDYVRSLQYIIENYTEELNREDIPQALRGQRNVIFGNVEKICEFHQQNFLHELERCENNPLKVGAAFLEFESKFYLYALYNKNKPKSDSLMSEYGTSFFKTKQVELDDKMDLASYLLKPVQRMGKYALLLQQLMKAVTSVQGPSLQKISEDIEELQRAEEMVRFQLRHGNDLLAMDSLRDCDVNVKEQGRLLRQNEFLVWQGRGGKKTLRQVFLFEELVLFSKARRFPDRKNLDIYLYKNSIKTSDIGLTAHIGDSPTKFEIWFRKRKPEDTWTLQSISEDVKNAWTDEVSKLLWKQAKRNREIRLAEMSSMGIGNKPCLDIRPSQNQINDRSITFSQLEKAPKFRNSFSGTMPEIKSTRRPNSIISLGSSFSSGTSSSSLSTSASSGSGGSHSARSSSHNNNSHNSNNNTSNNSNSSIGLELINETSTLQTAICNRKHQHQRSTTLISQLSMESGILADYSLSSPDADLHSGEHDSQIWPTCLKKTQTSSSILSTKSTSSSISSNTPSTTTTDQKFTIYKTKVDEKNNSQSLPKVENSTTHLNKSLSPIKLQTTATTASTAITTTTATTTASSATSVTSTNQQNADPYINNDSITVHL